MSSVTKLRVSSPTKLYCVYVRGNAELKLTEPRIFRLGSSFASLISPSATPTSDHLSGGLARVWVLLYTYPIRASLSDVLPSMCVWVRERTLKSESAGLGDPGIFASELKALPGNVTTSLSRAKKKRAAIFVFDERR